MRETFSSFIQYSDRETNLKFISCRTAVKNNEKEREKEWNNMEIKLFRYMNIFHKYQEYCYWLLVSIKWQLFIDTVWELNWVIIYNGQGWLSGRQKVPL